MHRELSWGSIADREHIEEMVARVNATLFSLGETGIELTLC
jgi:hypothetical protein